MQTRECSTNPGFLSCHHLGEPNIWDMSHWFLENEPRQYWLHDSHPWGAENPWFSVSVKLLGKEQKEICGVCNCFLTCDKSNSGIKLQPHYRFSTFQHTPSCLKSIVRITRKLMRNTWHEPWSTYQCKRRKVVPMFLPQGLLDDDTTWYTS